MVLQKTLNYGFVGNHLLQIPRATRSARRRSSFRKPIDDNPMFAFDLLATVAGNLLSEKERSPSSSDAPFKKEPNSVDTQFEGNFKKVPFVSEIVSQAPSSSDLPHVRNEDQSWPASVVTSSDGSEKIEDLKIEEKGMLLGSFAIKVEESCNYELNGKNKESVKVEAPNTENAFITKGDMYSSYTRIESDVKLPMCNEYISSKNVQLVRKDDDENSSRCAKFGTGVEAFRPSTRVGDCRIRKLLASKYWKVTSKSSVVANYRAESEMKSAYQCRKSCYKRPRSQRDYPFKKRRLYRCNSASSFGGENRGDNVNGGSRISACVTGHPSPLQSRDSNVKLKIKSFKVPELFIEIPENATVGNLKRTVLETVSAVLGGGLRVGVLLQGKKIRDDNRTLTESGISHDDALTALGFSLEPNPPQATSAYKHEDYPTLLSRDTSQHLERYTSSPRGVCSGAQPKKINALSVPPLLNLANFIESDHDSAPSPEKSKNNKNSVESRALVAAPAVDAEALNMVPLKKSKQCDSAQRRIRRPFSVAEVEALVQAVEKLGTGRWRDVKMRAFYNAKHRTYVDLKDKWKTLVHTARISPQQRRGEPVPQELLDRVLTAHAYWSGQQAKQQLKHHSETCLLL